MLAPDVEIELLKIADKNKAVILARFFKTSRGEYGEGDKFLGVAVPKQRKIAKKFSDLRFKVAPPRRGINCLASPRLGLSEVLKLLKSPIHECRLTALFILIHQYQKGGDEIKKKIFNAYLKNLKFVNNWDLVDLSAPKIVGDFLLKNPEQKGILYKLAKSNALWERRIAILSTFTFIRSNQFEDAFKIVEILLNDKHDLIHKAVGWMLREIGKIDQKAEEKFLKKYYKKMPRTMLRYAIEKFSADKKTFYMQ